MIFSRENSFQLKYRFEVIEYVTVKYPDIYVVLELDLIDLVGAESIGCVFDIV